MLFAEEPGTPDDRYHNAIRTIMLQPPIASRQNVRVKQAAALRNRRQRDQRQETLIHGARESMRSLAYGAELSLAFVCPQLFPNDEARDAHQRLMAAGVEMLEVTPEVFEKLAYGDRMDGVISVARTPARPMDGLAISNDPLIAVIEGVEKPGNLGALLRSADGAGVDALLVVDPMIDLFNPNVIRASVGSVFRPNVAVASVQEAMEWLGRCGVRIYATRPDAEQIFWEANLTGPTAIVFGAEAQGLTEDWSSASIQSIALPMQGAADSLNVSATGAILFYEARRQREEKRKREN